MIKFWVGKRRCTSRTLRPALDDLSKAFRVHDNPSSLSQNNLRAVEFIQILRDLLARGADETGERLMTDGKGDHGSPWVGRAKMMRQIRKLKSDPPAHVQADTANAVHVRLSVQIQRGGEAQKKISYDVPSRVSTKTCGLMEPTVEVSKASHLKGWRDSGTSESRPKNSPAGSRLTIVCRS